MNIHGMEVTILSVECNRCQFSGSPLAVKVHSCYVQEQGGRCEDYPCCGHTDGDGCQTLPSHTKEFYLENAQFMHEPGSPEWYDELDDRDHDYDPEED